MANDILLGEDLNRRRRLFDYNLLLRNISDGAETSTAAETGIAFDCRKLHEYVCVVYISACDSASSDETYTLSIGVSDVVGGTYTTVASQSITRGTTGQVIIPLSGALAQKLDDDSDFIQIKATLGGTTPSITYGAYLAPAVC